MKESSADTVVEWKSPPSSLALETGGVHVWRGILDRPPSDLQAYWNILHPIERQRAQRFVSSQHQVRFLAAHGMVRHVLGFYLNVHPSDLAFDQGRYGKPFLTSPPHTGMFFNLSHSQNLALLAITSIGEIGVDLEFHRPSINYRSIAERIMNEEEKAIFFSLSSSQQASAFFACWTRKEAFVKAHGQGLGFPLQAFSVTFGPLDPPRIVSIQEQHGEDHLWSMIAVSPFEKYTAALVVQGSPERMSYWHFPDNFLTPS